MELGADRVPCDELITTKRLFSLEMSRTHSSRSAVRFWSFQIVRTVKIHIISDFIIIFSLKKDKIFIIYICDIISYHKINKVMEYYYISYIPYIYIYLRMIYKY